MPATGAIALGVLLLSCTVMCLAITRVVAAVVDAMK